MIDQEMMKTLQSITEKELIAILRTTEPTAAATVMLRKTFESWQKYQPDNPLEFLEKYQEVKNSVTNDVSALMQTADLTPARLEQVFISVLVLVAPMYETLRRLNAEEKKKGMA